MFLQLGKIPFDKAYTPNGISQKDESSYAEHALASGKPRLQPTGNNLEEISFTVQLRAEIVNIAATVLELKKSKDNFEVLPVLMGTGQYRGDFVITSLENELISALPDGTPIETNVTISLKEYAVPDKLQQQQNAARKQAFAVGDKISATPVTPQKLTAAQEASNQLSLTASHADLLDKDVRSYENNASQQTALAGKMQYRLGVMDTFLQSAAGKIATIPEVQNGPALLAGIANVRSIIPQFTFPVSSTPVLKTNNLDLQTAMQALKTLSTQLINLVITRAA